MPAAQAPATAAGPAPSVGTTEAPGLLLVLGFALLGGLILNLMPCVFPVLSLKAISVLENRRGDLGKGGKVSLTDVRNAALYQDRTILANTNGCRFSQRSRYAETVTCQFYKRGKANTQ